MAASGPSACTSGLISKAERGSTTITNIPQISVSPVKIPLLLTAHVCCSQPKGMEALYIIITQDSMVVEQPPSRMLPFMMQMGGKRIPQGPAPLIKCSGPEKHHICSAARVIYLAPLHQRKTESKNPSMSQNEREP